MAEYHAAAARSEGLEADFEVATSARTRVDVVVDGRIGIEVQRSKLSPGAAVQRTARSMSAGLETFAWCAELGPVAWTGKVPGYQWLDNGQVLREMPRPRTVRSRGLLTFRAERSWGGGWEPHPEPLTVLVDEAVVRMVGGTIKPVIVGKLVQIVRADGIELYENLTGIRLTPFGTGIAPRHALSLALEEKSQRPPVRGSSSGSRVCEGDPFCEESPVHARTARSGSVPDTLGIAMCTRVSDRVVARLPGSLAHLRAASAGTRGPPNRLRDTRSCRSLLPSAVMRTRPLMACVISLRQTEVGSPLRMGVPQRRHGRPARP